MRQICKFDECKDITRAVAGLANSIPEALDYGTIVDTCAAPMFNQQKAVEEIGNRIYEPFDIIEYDRSYTKFRKYVNDSEYKRKASKGDED